MSEPTCQRSALLEAAFDNRLGLSEQASMDRHLESCASCAELLRDLTSVRNALRSAPSTITSLTHQRTRLAVLRRAATPATRIRRPTVLIAAALIVLPVAVWAAAAISTSREPPVVIVGAPSAPPPHATASQALIEVASAPLPEPSAAPSGPKKAPAPPSTSSREFAEAMDAIARGDFSAGASKLNAFAAAHPRDPRAEEAAYLEAIALERAGRMAEARMAAKRYLATYPAGAHRVPARRLAGDDESR